MAVQRLKLCTFTLGGLGSILLVGETRIPHTVWHGQKVGKKKQKKKGGETPSTHMPRQEMQETPGPSLGGEDLLEEEMATHSSILAWRIPRTRGAWWAAVHGVTRVGLD